METITIDCGGCRNRGPACDNCVVQVLLDIQDAPPSLTGQEQAAVAALAGQGLVPPLRLLQPLDEQRGVRAARRTA